MLSPAVVCTFPSLHLQRTGAPPAKPRAAADSCSNRAVTRYPRARAALPAVDGPSCSPRTAHPSTRPERTYPLEVSSFPSVVQSCDSLGQLKCVHAATIRSLLAPETFVANNLISSYVAFGEVSIARNLFDGLPERSVVTWTAVLNGYRKFGLVDEFAELFAEMMDNGVTANGSTFVCLLKFCGDRADMALGRQVHACALKSGHENVIVDSAVVHFYIRCGDVEAALAAFQRIDNRDIVSWTTMVAAFVQHGRHGEAAALISAMLHQGVEPNEFTVCSILRACADTRTIALGKQLHCAAVKRKWGDDVHVGRSLVAMYARSGEVSDARSVFDRMPKRNTITWTSMISGYAHSNQAEDAILLFRRMKRRRVFANSVTIVGVVSACGCLGQLNLGRELHGYVIKNLDPANIPIGSTLVSLYCKCRRYVYAARVLEAMPWRDTVSWTAMISGYAKYGLNVEALELLSGMLRDGVSPNQFTCSAALKASGRLEDIRYGKWVHGWLNKTASRTTAVVGSSLIDMYMRCGNVAEARKVFDGMPEPNAVTWKVMVMGLAKNGLCREAMKYMYQMRREGFGVDDFVLSTVLNSSSGEVPAVSESPAMI